MNQAVQLVNITRDLSGKWMIPILLNVESSGGRFTPLKNALQIAPSRLSDNLIVMCTAGLIQQQSPFERNHPLLPEYKLTEKGLFMKEAALVLSHSEEQLNKGFLAGKAWNWPVLIALYYEYHEFNSIRRLLDKPTPRIISTRLNQLHNQELVEKELISKPRPKFNYLLSKEARPILQMTNQNLSGLFI
ncbi:winged helix-turn-helix transcriptional regulator [Alkalicoccobacillus porphyridii]|uniref:HTH hxlR-type domain-containing protein n=1 Tax=Alkalicoccobacillus porphyridii TaxID=2597270 RepID=A0A553ZWX6_9BACI|nr:winged helix-turn-helix transcriptional regulator [Alkalicoccobacillus porphyridii]TSB45959.1 hypothetical protein FN960_13720 [Alkalicoccobacillus porphyridii]